MFILIKLFSDVFFFKFEKYSLVEDIKVKLLNLLLNNWDSSHCLFDGNPNERKDKQLSKEALENHEDLDDFKVASKFVELKYKPNTYYLFNVQEAHSVYNFSGKRYLLTLEFFKDKGELNYNQLVEEVKQGKWFQQ